MNKIEVVVVTGMSGAGKTQAMAIFENMEDIDYYKQVVEKTPIGKPVWSYWVLPSLVFV